MHLKSKHLFISLCVLFLIYSLSIYLKPLTVSKSVYFNSKKAAHGRMVWQDNNCQSCHQLYGLGGYLGPDLTNVYSNPKKGELVIRQMIKYGVKQMPAYSISEEDMSSLLEFLKSTDASGVADPRSFITTKTGMIEHNDKN